MSTLESLLLFFTLNREDFSFVIHLDRQPRTSRRREAQTGSRARSGSRSERTLDAVEHSRTLMEWWPFLIFHRGGLRIKVINNTCRRNTRSHQTSNPRPWQSRRGRRPSSRSSVPRTSAPFAHRFPCVRRTASMSGGTVMAPPEAKCADQLSNFLTKPQCRPLDRFVRRLSHMRRKPPWSFVCSVAASVNT